MTDSEALTNPQENDLQTLTHSIIEWRRLKEENDLRKREVREANTKMNALEKIILAVMKSHNIGALDLKASNGRLLYRRKQSKGGLSQKNLQGFLGEFLKDDTKAQQAVAFIDEKRGKKTMEVLAFETL